MTALENKIVEVLKSSIERLNAGKEVHLDTCSNWEQGFYVSDALQYKAVRPVVSELRNMGYLVTTGGSGGVTDYFIQPKLNMDAIRQAVGA